jgi:hypothetical protein
MSSAGIMAVSRGRAEGPNGPCDVWFRCDPGSEATGFDDEFTRTDKCRAE